MDKEKSIIYYFILVEFGLTAMILENSVNHQDLKFGRVSGLEGRDSIVKDIYLPLGLGSSKNPLQSRFDLHYHTAIFD